MNTYDVPESYGIYYTPSIAASEYIYSVTGSGTWYCVNTPPSCPQTCVGYPNMSITADKKTVTGELFDPGAYSDNSGSCNYSLVICR